MEWRHLSSTVPVCLATNAARGLARYTFMYLTHVNIHADINMCVQCVYHEAASSFMIYHHSQVEFCFFCHSVLFAEPWRIALFDMEDEDEEGDDDDDKENIDCSMDQS